MTTVVKYSFEGKARDLKLAHIPVNGGVCLVKVDGVEFEVKMLNGLSPRHRTYMARKVPAINSFVWDWHIGYLTGLRSQLAYSARMQKEYTERRTNMLQSQGINLQ